MALPIASYKSILQIPNYLMIYTLDYRSFLPKLLLPSQDGPGHVTECLFSASVLDLQRFPGWFHVKFGIGGLLAGIFGQPSFQLWQPPESIDDLSVGDRSADDISFVPRLRAGQAR